MLFQSAPLICDISPTSMYYQIPIKRPHRVVKMLAHCLVDSYIQPTPHYPSEISFTNIPEGIATL